MAKHQYVYVMKDLGKSYGTKVILKNVWLSFLPGAKIGVIGSNGAGKSTLFKIMAGTDKEFSGEAWSANGLKVGYLSQEPKLDHSKNVFDNVMEAVAEKKQLIDRFNEISNKFAEEMSDDEMTQLITEQGDLQEQIDSADAWNLEREITIAMHALRCPPPGADVSKISGGERRRIALCKLLLSKPDMLLLDEPTNHLDAESVAWLEKFLKDYAGTVVVITHDRYFLDNVTDWILEIDRGECIPLQGNYSSWLEDKERRMGLEEKSENDRSKQIKRELEWIRSSPKARQAKSKARISAYDKLVSENKEQTLTPTQIIIPDGPRLGDMVIEASDISKSFGERQIIDNLNFLMPPGAITGIIGANGMGKTTLFRMLMKLEQPDSGLFKVGSTVKLGYVDQSRDALNDDKSVWEEMSDGLDEIMLGKQIVKSRAYCAAFNFRGSDQQKKVGQLSGGERNRIHLANMLRRGANLILLDEPTNDLDVDTLRALEEALLNFSGCAMVISHDRWFLDRIATHILAFEGDGQVVWFEGNYGDYEQNRLLRNGGVENGSNKTLHRKISKS
jgi:ATP-binding cassette ChvD family protein